MTKRTRASKRAMNHFILNWNKMFEQRGWWATKRARATAWASNGDEGRKQRVMARTTRAAMATATRVAGDEEGEGVEEGNESFYS
jgi:hypothetical protein